MYRGDLTVRDPRHSVLDHPLIVMLSGVERRRIHKGVLRGGYKVKHIYFLLKMWWSSRIRTLTSSGKTFSGFNQLSHMTMMTPRILQLSSTHTHTHTHNTHMHTQTMHSQSAE